ncbi:MAG: response regulator transcription factor [Chromatiales bacterium]|nr:response regulator transcription factor [Chromatiales bacterium]
MKILIVDDESLARARLASLIAEIGGDLRVVGEASSGQEAIEKAELIQPHVVLLDIAMPGKDGIATARELAEHKHPPAVIFTTAFNQHALEAFEVQAAHYLLKPVRRQALEAALRKAARVNRAQLAELSPDYAKPVRATLTARRGKDLMVIPVGEINYFRADQKYVAVYHSKGVDLIEESLKSLEDEFGERFVRVHRNALVARKRIASVRAVANGQHEVCLLGVEEGLEVSRRHLPALRKLLNAG